MPHALSHASRLALIATVTAAVAFTTAPPVSAAAPGQHRACGFNPGRGWPVEDPYYDHCATNTNVWIRVNRALRPDYERCVGPGRTKLDKGTRGAHYIGQLCSNPGETRGV
jgi:hypothetical protein